MSKTKCSNSIKLTRSFIDTIIDQSRSILDAAGFVLPPFASWTPQQWRDAGEEWDETREARLGWDVTDFGLGDFFETGRVLFTLRNGIPRRNNKPYAEKIILGRNGQRSPAHYHLKKIEDIINRGGGDVIIRLSPASKEAISCHVFRDGRAIELSEQTDFRLSPGESLCITPGVIHQIWGEETQAGQIPLIGEISSVCDDINDNIFLDQVVRFSSIKEDKPARYALCHELPATASL